MRSDPLRRLILLTLLVGLGVALRPPSKARGEDESLRIALELPETIRVGDRFEVVAVVHTPIGEPRPLLLTPTSEGTAVEVVRGRLLRSDAEDPATRPLRFHIPAVARAPGDSVLRVHVLAYECAEHCRPVEAEAVTRVRALRP